MIRGRDLARAYGDRPALRGVTLDVAPGEVVALLGPNGAGKSTLLLVLAGILPPTRGDAHVAGFTLPQDAALVGTRIGFVPQGDSVYPELTARENARHFASLHGVPRALVRERADATLREVGLDARANDRAGALSGGLRQRLALACSLAHDPQVLLLDEPGTGLDPAARERLARIVRARRDQGAAVLLTTHSLEEAERVADRVLLLVDGRIADARPASDARALETAFRQAEAEA